MSEGRIVDGAFQRRALAPASPSHGSAQPLLPDVQEDASNPFTYAHNNPLRWKDPTGLLGDGDLYEQQAIERILHSPNPYGSRNRKFLDDFITGGGATTRNYTIGDIETREMVNSPGGQALINAFYRRGCKDLSSYSCGVFQAARDTLPNPRYWNTSLQVGGFIGSAKVNGNYVTFSIPNYASAKSFFYHAPFMHNRKSPTGPFRTIKQVFTWTELIDKNRCPCR